MRILLKKAPKNINIPDDIFPIVVEGNKVLGCPILVNIPLHEFHQHGHQFPADYYGSAIYQDGILFNLNSEAEKLQ